MQKPDALAWTLLALLGFVWGGSFLGVEMALTGFGPLSVAAGRITVAAVILIAWAFATGAGLPSVGTRQGRRIWRYCLGMALFTNAIPFSLLSWGQQQVTSGFAGVTMAVVPLLILPLAHLLVPGETLTPRRAAGFLTGFAGVVVLVTTGASGDISAGTGTDSIWLARAACIAASFCYATGAIITRLAPPVPQQSFAAGGLLLAALFILPVALITEGLPQAEPPARAIAGLLYLGLFPTALATILLVHIIRTTGPSFMSLVNFQVPVWAVVIGAVVLGEQVPPQFIGALALILSGLAIARTGQGRTA